MRGLLKRLPVLLIAVLGVWLWKGGAGVMPVERVLVWQLPGDLATIRAVEVQLWDGDELLKREALSTPTGARLDVVQRLLLKKGTYQAKVFVRRAGATAPETLAPTVIVGGEETVVISLR